MKTKRKSKSKIHLLAMIWGIIFSSFMFLSIGIKILGSFFDDSPGNLSLHFKTFLTWDDPSPYFLTYMIGYIMVWWKPLWGSIIILAFSIVYVIIAGVGGPPIFAAPGFLVGALYFIYWFVDRRNQIKAG